MRVRPLLLVCVLLGGLAFPAAGSANHVGVAANVNASLIEWTGTSWVVEVRWFIGCSGPPGEFLYFGDLSLIDLETGAKTPLGGVSSRTGTSRQLVAPRKEPHRVKPELRAACSGDEHGSDYITVAGGDLIIPGKNGDMDVDPPGGGGESGAGGGGEDPTEPLRDGGCGKVLLGTPDRDDLLGGDAGDIIFGLGSDDRLRGGKGHDCLIGSGGDDTLRGGKGWDRLIGGRGRDKLYGGSGKNAYDAGRGRDYINAVNNRKERVHCGKGRDRARVDKKDKVRSCEVVVQVD